MVATTEETLRIAAATRTRLINATRGQEVAITAAWVQAWDRLDPELRASIAAILARYAAGQRVTPSMLRRDARLRAALAQVRDTLQHIATSTATTSTTAAAQVIVDAGPDLERIIHSQLPPEVVPPQDAPRAPGRQVGDVPDLERPLPPNPVGMPAPDPVTVPDPPGQRPAIRPSPVAPTIQPRLPAANALDAMVARTQQRIHSRLWALSEASEEAMKRELLRGITVGENPRVVARRIIHATQGEFEGGLGRALNIARTEILDAYRDAASFAAKQNTDILAGRRWLASLDSRTCGSCLSKHGEVFPVDAWGPIDHPSGRCAFVDVTKSWSDLGFEGMDEEPVPAFPDRDEWWANLTDSTKRSIVGPTRANLMAEGRIDWDQLATLRTNPGWRDSYGLTSVRDLVG